MQSVRFYFRKIDPNDRTPEFIVVFKEHVSDEVIQQYVDEVDNNGKPS